MRGRPRHGGGYVGIDLSNFAESIGGADHGPLWIAGQQTRTPAPSQLRLVAAPAGIVDLQPDEMTVVCGAGTPINELRTELAKVGQYVNLPDGLTGPGTVGGALAEGHSDIYRLGRGPVRDTLLQVRYVNHDGQVVTAGGPTVKNVSGFDLCRLLIGSHGQLGYFGETILRTRPLPQSSRWFVMREANQTVVEKILRVIYRPASVLWDGHKVWFCIEGNPKDCAAMIQRISVELPVITEISEPPDLSLYPHRQSVPPRLLGDVVQESARSDSHKIIVEAGVGIVHHQVPPESTPIEKGITILHRQILEQFNPTGRLNPGIEILASAPSL